ncbi:MAG: calcium/sodium antiporter [Acidobacteriota bacterium]
MTLSILAVVVGLAGLYFGAEWLVRGAGRIAVAFGVSPLVIGLTVVAFGTSMPEMVAGAVAAWNGATDVLLGNVIGSNIANVGLILGLAALLRPIPVELVLLRRELPFMLIVTLGVMGLATRGEFGPLDGILLVGALVAFTALALRWARGEGTTIAGEFEEFETARGFRDGNLAVDAGLVVAGLVVLTVGAQLLVNGAVTVARYLGVSEFLISVTMVALGTSLPELATSVVAAARDEADVLVGNIVGSNIFNLLGALGVGALIARVPVAGSILSFDMIVMLLLSLAMTVFVVRDRRITRLEGALLLAAYLVYLVLIF